MTISDTQICNMALRGIGAKRINNLDESNSQPEAIECRTFYDHVRDSLLRSYDWPFARTRIQLSEDTETPDFEYDHQFYLPSNYLRLRTYYDTDAGYDESSRLWKIEGRKVLTNYESVYLRYIKKITDPLEFDPLFTELFVCRLQVKLLYSLAGIENVGSTRDRLNQEMQAAEARARVVAAAESDPHDKPDYIRSQFTDDLLVI